MLKIRLNKNSLITYSVCFVFVFILFRARIFDVAPFGFAFASVAVFLGLNPFAISAMLLFSTLPDLNVFVTLYTLYGGFILVLCSLILKRIKNVKPYFVFIPSLVCSMGHISYMITNHLGAYKIALYLFLLLAFTSVCYCFAVPTFKRKFKFALVQHEAISGFVILVFLACGLKNLEFFGFNPLMAVFGVFIPLSFKIFGDKNTLVAAVCMGLGNSLTDGDVSIIAAFAFTAIMALIFKTAPKPFMPIVALISYSAFVLYFNVEYGNLLWSLIMLAIGGIFYILIPGKKVRAVADFLSNDFDRTALRYIVNQSRYETGNSLAALGQIFNEMASVMRESENGSGPDVEGVSRYVRGQICADCPKGADCKRIPAMNRGLYELSELSLKNGRVGVGDLPTPITQYCCNVASVMASAAEAAEKASRQYEQTEVENKAREIVADQLVGLADILTETGRNSSQPFSYDSDLEKRVMEELVYVGVTCGEALITGISEPESVTLVVMTDNDFKSEKIEECVNRCLGKKLKIVRQEDSILSGWTIVELKCAPVYDALFGFAGRTKDGSEISGDTHSFIKLTHDKFMMALCDGMGSGTSAHEFSVTTISLIESFYKAGFEHDLVLENVNKFLSIGGRDIFSAVDVCVADLKTGVADIIKIGSPSGYLKTSDSLIKISGASLPMGMLDEIKPTVRSLSMASGDILLVMSDGVSDCFTDGSLDDFINNLPTLNPSELCSKIVERAVALSQGASKDDMSVAAFKLFYS